MSIAIIANPLAGRGRGAKTAQTAREILTTKNIDHQLIYTEYPGHAIGLARRASQQHEVVAALGGDGTIREVLEGVWQSQASLGIIPGGTGNDYARGLQIPREVGSALEVLLAGRTALFDVGLENDLIFGVSASIGFPVDVLNHVNNHRNGFWKGQAAFLASVVATIRELRTYPIRVTMDGKILERQVVAAFVMNMPYSGGGMKFTPEARHDNGLFHLLLIEDISKPDMAVTLPKIYSGRHVTHPAVTILTGQDIMIESDPLPIMLDGDIFPSRLFHTKIAPQKARLIMPKAPVL